MASSKRPALIVFAYACSPSQGSEHGAGWGIVTALREFANVTVLTGSRHIDEIRSWEAASDSGGTQFVEVSDRRLGPLSRWHRVPEFLVYLAWLRKARTAARSLLGKRHFDASIHATFSASWLPTTATALGIPSVWGPVGGGVTTPRPLWRLLGIAGVLGEILDMSSVRAMAALPVTRRSIRRASERLVQNQESLDLLPLDTKAGTKILNHAQFTMVPEYPAKEDGGYTLWVSPMESRKGPVLAVEALARTDGGHPLIMVGDGPQQRHVEQLAKTYGISDRVTLTGRIERDDVIEYMRGATTVIFTGLREEGGLALAEAMHSARRLIVLDHGGAGTIARAATDPSRVTLIPTGSVEEVASGFAKAIDAHHAAEDVEPTPLLDRSAAVAELRDIVLSAANG